MRGNTNANNDGNGKDIKILNVVQMGTLTRDGAVFSGFGASDYLKLGARVDKGILSLDTAFYIKYNSNLTSNDEIEFGTKIITGSDLTTFQNIIGWDNTIDLFIENSYLKIWSESQGQAIALWEFSGNTNYWIKVTISGSNKTTYYSIDGITYNNITTTDTIFQPYNSCRIGNGVSTGSSRPFLGSIDIGETYIKVNGDFWWKGVETL